MQHLEQFYHHLQSQQYAKSTVTGYKYVLQKAARYFSEQGITNEQDITESLVVSYLTYVEENHHNWFHLHSTYSLKKYFEYLITRNILFINPMLAIDLPKEKRHPIPILSKQDITNIIAKIDPLSHAGIRFRTIIELMYSSALRTMEVTNLTLADVDYVNKELFIRLGKNKKDRVVPIGTLALEWLKKYITEVRPKYLKNKDSPYIFLAHNSTGKKINYQGLYHIFWINCKRYGITHFKPYSLRPSSATHLLHNGMSILHIQKLLGHEEVSTTQQYYDKYNIMESKWHKIDDFNAFNTIYLLFYFT